MTSGFFSYDLPVDLSSPPGYMSETAEKPPNNVEETGIMPQPLQSSPFLYSFGHVLVEKAQEELITLMIAP